MTTDVLNKEIRALPSEYISQVEKFVLYLKLKMEFGKIERDMNETLNRKSLFLTHSKAGVRVVRLMTIFPRTLRLDVS